MFLSSTCYVGYVYFNLLKKKKSKRKQNLDGREVNVHTGRKFHISCKPYVRKGTCIQKYTKNVKGLMQA